MPITVPMSPSLPMACRSICGSHAHGQGYTDLNFIIPETITEGVDVHKGAYLPEYGDFATAGAVNFRTREVVAEGAVQSAGGQFNTQRHLLMFSPTKDAVRTLLRRRAITARTGRSRTDIATSAAISWARPR
ncbi:MAG: hypothetical protein U0231_09090 [Nitrospiraceae bacterium]